MEMAVGQPSLPQLRDAVADIRQLSATRSRRDFRSNFDVVRDAVFAINSTSVEPIPHTAFCYHLSCAKHWRNE
jgi:hypothetical protein